MKAPRPIAAVPITAVTPAARSDILPSRRLATLAAQDSNDPNRRFSMDHVPASQLMPLCAAAAIAWGHIVDYPSLVLDSKELEAQLQRMEVRLRSLIPLYGEDRGKVRTSDLYHAIKTLRFGSLPLEWWVAQQKPRELASQAVEFHFRLVPALRHAA
jgi:hypothetical protein